MAGLAERAAQLIVGLELARQNKRAGRSRRRAVPTCSRPSAIRTPPITEETSTVANTRVRGWTNAPALGASRSRGSPSVSSPWRRAASR